MMILIRLLTLFCVEQSSFENKKWFMSYTQKFKKKWQKSVYTKKTSISEPTEISCSKPDTTILKPVFEFNEILSWFEPERASST